MTVISKDDKKVKISKEDKELLKYLKGIQKLLNKNGDNLSEETKLLADVIVASAEAKSIIAPFAEIDENGIVYDFKLDYGSKSIFKDLSPSVKIDAFNSILNSKFKKKRKMTFGFTEYFNVIGNKNKYYIRGDLTAIIENGLDDDLTDIVMVEIQAKDDDDVIERAFMYGNNNYKLIRRLIKKIINKKQVLEEDDVFVRPYEMIIYASTKFKEASGIFRVNVTAPYFETNGIKRRGKKGDVITYFIPFINIFQMSLEELNNSKFFFLQCLYLYKYRQDQSLLEKEEKIAEIASQIERNLEKKLSPEDFAVAIKQHRNLCSDLSKIVEHDPVKFRKVRDDMLAVRETFYDVTRKERTFEIVLRMIKEHLTDETISKCSGISIDEIAKIREEHSNQ